jgi:hypothetical protein
MKLTRLSGTCYDGTCPTLYRSDAGTLVVQGRIVETSDLTPPEGEAVVEIAPELVPDLLKQITDLGWWLANFQRSAFRLERLQAYFNPAEAELLAAFQRGEDVQVPDDHPWPPLVHRATQAGKTMQRVRMVEHPLSDYLRFELSLFPRSAEAGEDIRIASLDDHPELEACQEDFWLFDDEVVVVLTYDERGRFLGSRIEPDLDRYRKLRELALSCSMELSAYTTRTAGR